MLVRLPIIPGVTNAQMSVAVKALCATRPISDSKNACGEGVGEIELRKRDLGSSRPWSG
jgi:hypothetical protein